MRSSDGCQVREHARYLHYSLYTEKAYLYWVRWFHTICGIRAW